MCASLSKRRINWLVHSAKHALYSINTFKYLNQLCRAISSYQWLSTFGDILIFSRFGSGKSVSVYSKVILIILWNNSFQFFSFQSISHAVHMKSLICYKFADGENVYALQIEIYYGMPSRCCFFLFIIVVWWWTVFIPFLLILLFIIYFFSPDSHWVLIYFKETERPEWLIIIIIFHFFFFILQTLKRMNRK